MGEAFPNSPIVMRPWPRWLCLADAVVYAHLGKDRLMALAQVGEIVGYQDPADRRGKRSSGAWIFDRESLDAWRLRQAGQGPVLLALAATQGR